MSEPVIGTKREFDSTDFECIALGSVTEDHTLSIDEGRTILADGPEVMVEFLDDDGHVAVWQTVVSVEQERKKAKAEVEIDSLMPQLRKELLSYEEQGWVPVAVCGSFMRAALALGFLEATKKEQPEEWFRDLGYAPPEKEEPSEG